MQPSWLVPRQGCRSCFSPVSRIHSIATEKESLVLQTTLEVSVPFPGFTQLQLCPCPRAIVRVSRFSPVSRIHSIATRDLLRRFFRILVVSVPFPGFTQLQPRAIHRRFQPLACFSPVSRIHSIATLDSDAHFRGYFMFQSRFQDSLNCNKRS